MPVTPFTGSTTGGPYQGVPTSPVTIPGTSVTVEANSGLGNTLIGNGSASGSAEVGEIGEVSVSGEVTIKIDQNGQTFDTDLSGTGSVSVDLGNGVEANVSVTIDGETVTVDVDGTVTTHNFDDLGAGLQEDLERAGLSPEAAAAIAHGMTTAVGQTIQSAENSIRDALKDAANNDDFLGPDERGRLKDLFDKPPFDPGSNPNPDDDLPGSGSFPSPIPTPLVIDLDGDGVELVALANSHALFDLDQNGFAERTAWVSADDALLAYDVNGNGVIDDKSELFGDSGAFADGFASLGSLDSNNDGVINVNDAAYANLVLWQDAEGDGFTENGELISLSDAGLESISLSATIIQETNQGNDVTHRSSVTWTDGTTTNIDDVWFQTDNRIAAYRLPEGFEFDPIVFSLPGLAGYGNVKSTWVALSEDPSLITMSEALLGTLQSGDVAQFLQDFEAFVLEWAGVGDVDPESRGAFVDARHLELLEAMYGTGFEQLYRPTNTYLTDPNAAAGPLIEQQYDELIEKLAARFMVQGPGSLVALDPNSDYSDYLFGSLAQLEDGMTVANFHISNYANFDAIVHDLLDKVGSGGITLANAALALELIGKDFSNDTNLYVAFLAGATSTYSDASAASSLLSLLNTSYAIVDGTVDADVLGNGNIATIYDAGLGNDTIAGGEHGDVYLYSFGDGNDVINDRDWYNDGGADTFVFTDVNVDDVTFSQNAGQDLVMTLANGETVTITDQFHNYQDQKIETISFADGTVLNVQAIRDKSVADMKATGIVTGSEQAEHYTHTSGDGSYTITDRDDYNDGGADRFTFTDVDVDDVTFSQNAGNDLVMILANGETITIIDQFQWWQYNKIETISFADGTVLNAQAIRDKSVADMKATGNVLGSQQSENYKHTIGDGSYTITDRDDYNDSGADSLVFTDVNVSDVTFSQNAGNDLVMTLANGETVTIVDGLHPWLEWSIETISFADGTVLNQQAIRDKSVADMKTTGAVVGTERVENYTHTSGDGSYTITDRDDFNDGGADSFVFTDVNVDDVTFSQNAGNDLVMTLANGEVVTIVDGLHPWLYWSVETISFADGTVLNQQAIRDKSVADMKTTGAVVGTERVENYTHTSGDGSYTITDRDDFNDGGADSFVFTDVVMNDIDFGKDANDLILSLSNGEDVTIYNFFAAGHDYAVEDFHFSDGSVLTSAQIYAAPVSGGLLEL